ncbi:sulfatase [Allomuricauda sp. SCSIO 65647]|uniref:sulfatase family protein n=1 Tax=Allomuricauda sp. SCSIO 65647 TaxID=2908843 RepID=UPI001F1BD99E|nr:sulfatase-like hydrolase/transferase [Muricauda sp. SCSIO 65647]UJH67838.1 sulfatase-like hydrolase/transferase [Muricauda sp. SCSIO 65647]
MQRYRTLKKTILFLGIALFLSCIQKKHEKNGQLVDKRPNILFITTDYTRGSDLEYLGRPLRMPVLQDLIANGAVFTKHSSVSPICMPARASIVTGLYPHTHSLWDNRAISVKKPNWPFLTRDLQSAGYTTLGIGKMHFHPFQEDYYYDHRVTLEGKDRDYRDDDYEKYLEAQGTSRKALRAAYSSTGRPRGQDFYPWPADEKLHPDYFVGEAAVDAIKSGEITAEKPWFMWVSFTGPHNPWNPPKRFFDRYSDLDKIPDALFTEGELIDKPIEYSRHRYGYGGNLMQHYDSLPKNEQEKLRKQVKAGHFASLTFIDEQIERVLFELGQTGKLENTIVVFTSDHGSALFDNEMLHKGSSFPTQSLVPMVVWRPGLVKQGIREGFTSHVDLYATFMELAQGEIHPMANGKSMLGMLTDDKEVIKDFVVIESTLVTSLMNDRWLVGFHHVAKEIELYDLKKDPMCHTNIASDPETHSIIAELQETLVQWRREQNPGLIIGDDPLHWNLEVLGDAEKLESLRKSYIKAYNYLTTLDDSDPGIVGKKAKAIVQQIDN